MGDFCRFYLKPKMKKHYSAAWDLQMIENICKPTVFV